MALRDEMEEAKAAGDEATMAQLRRQVIEGAEATEARVREIATRVATAPNYADRLELRQHLNAQQYWGSLRRQLS